MSYLVSLASANRLIGDYTRGIFGKRKVGVHDFLCILSGKESPVVLTDAESQMVAGISSEDKRVILDSACFFDQLWKDYGKWVYKCAHSFMKRNGIAMRHLETYEGEAILSFLRAARGYKRSEIKFTTYLYHVIRRELCRVGTDIIDTGNVGVLRRYRELEDTGTFDEVVERLGLSKKEIRRLNQALVASAGVEDINVSDFAIEDKERDYEFLRAIESVELSILERDSWCTQREVSDLFPSSFQNYRAVARQHGVTHQAVSLAAQRANEKIKSRLVQLGYK